MHYGGKDRGYVLGILKRWGAFLGARIKSWDGIKLGNGIKGRQVRYAGGALALKGGAAFRYLAWDNIFMPRG